MLTHATNLDFLNKLGRQRWQWHIGEESIKSNREDNTELLIQVMEKADHYWSQREDRVVLSFLLQYACIELESFFLERMRQELPQGSIRPDATCTHDNCVTLASDGFRICQRKSYAYIKDEAQLIFKVKIELICVGKEQVRIFYQIEDLAE